MPPRGYRSVSLPEELYRRLEELRVRLGLRSLPEVISHLLREHGLLEDRVRLLEERVARLEKLVAAMLSAEKWGSLTPEEVEEAGEELSRRLLEGGARH